MGSLRPTLGAYYLIVWKQTFTSMSKGLRSKSQGILEEVNRQKWVVEASAAPDVDPHTQETQYLFRKYQRKKKHEHLV